jgi:adenine-specific DNA-methyltransferase
MEKMEKIAPSDPETRSADLTAENIAQLKALFPEAFPEGKIDFDVLKQLLGGAVDDKDEKYGLNWHGKRRARQLALTPSTGTLRPCPEDSVDWDTTQNLMIEGDNLEVLKLLQKSYAGKVKLIYIDPPYNTGKDFVYPDDYRDNIKNYLERTGQVDGEGRKTSSNTEASGRFHTDWLNMMYPRLKLARNLLSNSGLIFISIDDNEINNLRQICTEIFGEENFIAQIIWKKRSTPPNDKIIGANHDYIICLSKDKDSASLNLRVRSEEQVARYQNPDGHPKGPWAPGDLMANVKGGRFVPSLYFPIINPNTNEEHYPGKNGNWRFSAKTIEELIASNSIYFGEDGKGKPKLKRFLCDVKSGVTYPTIWDFTPFNTSGSNEMDSIFGSSSIFESPKPTGLIQEILKLGTDTDSLILDFFAGSGTISHSVFLENCLDGGTRRFIAVQLPELVSPDSEAARFGFSSIAELTKERLRRAGNQVKAGNSIFSGDIGFRVFKLDSSNIRIWDSNSADLEASLLDAIEHIKEGRTETDVLYELLLKFGLELTVPIESRVFGGKTVHSIGAGTLLICLAERITRLEVEELTQGIAMWRTEQSPSGEVICVFRDSAFVDDVTKTNLMSILEQHNFTRITTI